MEKATWFYKIICITLFIFFVSCISFYHHPDGGFRPKKPNFSLKKKELLLNTIIDSMAVYVYTDTLKFGKNNEYQRITFLKFYNNGCYLKSNINIKNKIDKNNLTPGSIGYYQIHKKTINTEIFDTDIEKGKSEYVKRQGIIKGDSIILDAEFIKGGKDIYIKQKIDFVAKPANW